MKSEIIHGDCLTVLREMDDNSVDSIVTDPPYGISFMSRKWDDDCPKVAIWEECLRILKPGGYLLAFSGTRTVDLVMGKIREAGFEIRDMITWMYGQGFPKSLDISKALDKALGAERKITGEYKWPDGKKRNLDKHKAGIWDNETVKGEGFRSTSNPVTPAAQEWDGWGTALKPACEPITMARKRIDKKTVAANMLEYRTGAINVDGCRIEYGNETDSRIGTDAKSGGSTSSLCFGDFSNVKDKGIIMYKRKGRWPANVLLDEEAARMLDEQSGERPSGGGEKHPNKPSTFLSSIDRERYKGASIGGDTGGASRFFYCAKASRAEREAGLEGFESRSFQSGCGGDMPLDDDGKDRDRFKVVARNAHPTVKPISVMRWLCRLVTPPGGLIVDPFAGTGTTVIAAGLEGFSCIGIEKEEEYARIAQARVAHWLKLSPSEVAELFVPDNEEPIIHNDKQTTFAF